MVPRAKDPMPCQPGATPQGERGKTEMAESPIHARRRWDETGFQPSAFSIAVTQGCALGWYGIGPLALEPIGSRVRDRRYACITWPPSMLIVWPVMFCA